MQVDRSGSQLAPARIGQLCLPAAGNHLSLIHIYLKRFQGALLMVTHDRYFLERVVNRIVELDHGKLYSYPANYSSPGFAV